MMFTQHTLTYFEFTQEQGQFVRDGNIIKADCSDGCTIV